jgi:Predicted acetyltransferase, GNAT superfamily
MKPTAPQEWAGALPCREDEARCLGASAVTCEVNLEPPNPGSLAFHHREGFRDLDTQATKGGAVVVQLMAKEIR